MMETLFKLLTGEHRYGQGVESRARSGAYGELVVNDVGLGRYFELVRHGRVFSTVSKAVTITATHNSPIAAATATPVCGFGNISTNYAAVLLGYTFTNVSGTPAGGQVVLNLQDGVMSKITAAATGSIFNHLLQGGASPQGSVMKPLNNVVLGGWLGTPNAVQEVCLLGGSSAAAVAGSPGASGGWIDLGGLFIVPPGGLCALMAGSGAGTSWIVNAGLTWAEIEWPL